MQESNKDLELNLRALEDEQAEASERLSVKYQNYVGTRLTAPEESGSMKPPEQ